MNPFLLSVRAAISTRLSETVYLPWKAKAQFLHPGVKETFMSDYRHKTKQIPLNPSL